MDREAFRTEVATHMMGLVGRVSGFATAYSGAETNFGRLRQELIGAAGAFATALEEPSTQEKAAEALCIAMFGEQEPPEAFWRTEAGRAVALAIGYPRTHAPRTAAAAVLGVSRQRIGEMIQKDKLEGDRDSVTADSLRAALRRKVSGAA